MPYVLLGMLALVALFLTRAFRQARMRQAYNRTGGAADPMGTGQTSEVRTRYLRMVLDHDSGEMNGDVLEGAYSGRTLRSLGLTDLLALLKECRDDAESVQVLSAYLDRYH
jgi:hypothetical protein